MKTEPVDVAILYDHASDNGRIRREVVRRSLPLRRSAARRSNLTQADIEVIGRVIGELNAEQSARSRALETRVSALERSENRR